MKRGCRKGLSVLLLGLLACTDAPTPAEPAMAPSRSTIEGAGRLSHYVAIGTSVSMGYQSDGANDATQQQSWPAQLARMAGSSLPLPRISGFGCKAPIAAPLASGLRISGEPVTTPDSLLRCDPLLPGVDLPAGNVAINGATTLDALLTTPETARGLYGQRLYSRILPPGTTQLHAALAQHPQVVSVELGANEVLGARSGVAIPGVTIVPPNVWAPTYDALVDTVAANVRKVVLVGLIQDAATFPGFRRGAELSADAPMLLGAFHVAVAADCSGSPNLLFVPVRVPTAISIGLYNRAHALPPFVLSCADGGPGVVDYVLTPAEAGVVNATLIAMTQHVRQLAQQRGLAYFALEALYGRAGLKPPFSSVALMTSMQPYGPLITLDGIHPSGAGQAILARAAAQALNRRYAMHIPDAAPTRLAR